MFPPLESQDHLVVKMLSPAHWRLSSDLEMSHCGRGGSQPQTWPLDVPACLIYQLDAAV